LVRDGKLEPEAIFDHPQRHVITRALGYQPELKVDLRMEELRIGDRLLLCSDGLWEMIRKDEEIATPLIEADNLERAVEELISRANAGGGSDNIAAIAAEVVGPGRGRRRRRPEKSR
jgi:protein phosphatase